MANNEQEHSASHAALRSGLGSRLAVKIRDHIREQQMSPGQHLPEQALADLFRVSRAPVRAALLALRDEGLLKLERNRGFFLLQAGNDLPDANPGVDDGDEPYLTVAADRLAGKLPERVSENELMRRYDLPRGQVVKVLARIAQEGWAERLPGKGWAFLPALTSREAYDHGYRFRAALEAAAVQEPAFRVNGPELLSLRTEQRRLLDGDLKRLSRVQLFQANSGFHEVVVGWCGNPFFLDALRRVNSMRRLAEYHVTIDRSRLDRQCREHLELLDLLEAGELVTAAAFLRVHIEGARRIKTVGLA